MNKLPVWVTDYDDLMQEFPDHFCKEQKQLMKRVKNAYQEERLIVYEDRFNNYVGLGKYFGFTCINRKGEEMIGYEWERFIIGCLLCTYTAAGEVRWKRSVIYVGRGAGKSGLIAWIAFALVSPYNPVAFYDVDIGAFNEKQALRPVADVRAVLNNNEALFKPFFKWTLECITNTVSNAPLRGWANNSKGLDGLRSGAVLLDEIHAYENNKTMQVFKSGLGKKPDPRLFHFTTEGYIIDGPLDGMIKKGKEILADPKADDGKWFYFICKLDDEAEAYEPDKWHKANPTLMYNKDLLSEITDVFEEWKADPAGNKDFLCKRMNLKQVQGKEAVASLAELEATNQIIPDLSGRECIAGIDFAKNTDWAAVNLHFRDGDKRYDINHAWICLQSDELWRLKCPYQEWADKGLITLVDGPEIPPDMIAEYIDDANRVYNVRMVCIDSFRYSLMAKSLENVGFSAKDKTLYLVRPSDQMRIAPVILRAFRNHFFYWGDNPVLRWATNNACLIPSKKSRLAEDGEADTGNYIFGKQERASRKTDPFMAVVASMAKEDDLAEYSDYTEDDFMTFNF